MNDRRVDSTRAERTRADGLLLTDDPDRLDPAVHRWLSTDAYWALGRTADAVRARVRRLRAVRRLPAGGRPQVAVARVVTDGATFAWLCDVYVDPADRGRGHGQLAGPRGPRPPGRAGRSRILLATKTPTGVYATLGFSRPTATAGWSATCRPRPVDRLRELRHMQGAHCRRDLTVSGMSEERRGYLYGLGAYVLWGFFPLYFKLLRPRRRWRSWPTGSSGRWSSSACCCRDAQLALPRPLVRDRRLLGRRSRSPPC